MLFRLLAVSCCSAGDKALKKKKTGQGLDK